MGSNDYSGLYRDPFLVDHLSPQLPRVDIDPFPDHIFCDTPSKVKPAPLPLTRESKIIVMRYVGNMSKWLCNGKECAPNDTPEYEVINNLVGDGWELINVVPMKVPFHGEEVHYYLKRLKV